MIYGTILKGAGIDTSKNMKQKNVKIYANYFYSKDSKLFWIFLFDTGILNTMTNEIVSANTLLERKGISILDAARLICNALDCLPKNSTLSPI